MPSCRARGVGACVATFTVGGLSIINAIAGAYSEDLPVICITGAAHFAQFRACSSDQWMPAHRTLFLEQATAPCADEPSVLSFCMQPYTASYDTILHLARSGLWKESQMDAGGPNSNDSNSNKLLHHTIGLLDREQEMRCFQQVTCAQVPARLPTHPFLGDGCFALGLFQPAWTGVHCREGPSSCGGCDGRQRCSRCTRRQQACSLPKSRMCCTVPTLLQRTLAQSLGLPFYSAIRSWVLFNFALTTVSTSPMLKHIFDTPLRPTLQAAVKHLDDAHDQLDLVIATALRERKPVYINIACNLAGETHPTFTEEPIPFAIYPKVGPAPALAMRPCFRAEALHQSTPVLDDLAS